MQARRIVLLGATGFVGHALVPRLARDGHRLTLLTRNRARHRELALVPGTRLVDADVHDPAVLARHLAGAEVAINLVGILNGRRDDGRDFQRAHVELTEKLVAACRAAGVPRLLQMSALGAGEGTSFYLRSRGEAEERVRASGLAWTIFRPSVIFGREDGLFFRFAALLRHLPVLPLARADALFQPVFVGDVARAMARSVVHPSSIGQCYELGGPERLTLAEIVQQTARMLGLRRWVLPLPDALGHLQARVGEWLPGKPITRDNFRSLAWPSVTREDGLAALGIVPTPIAAVMPALLAPAAPAPRRR